MNYTNVEAVEKIEAVKNEVISLAWGRSAWQRGVIAYAFEMVEELKEALMQELVTPYELSNPDMVEDFLLNGAEDWKQYSWGGCSFIYNEDIAKRLCNPSELKKTHNGERRPNKREEWLDTQARALFQACVLVRCASKKVFSA